MTAYHMRIAKQLATGCGPTDGGLYDMSSACSTCGTGARRLAPIRLPGSLISNRVAVTWDREVTIPPRLAGVIREIAPRCLREIYDAESGARLPHSQLVPEIVLPKWNARTTGWAKSKVVPSCPVCDRDGFLIIRILR